MDAVTRFQTILRLEGEADRIGTFLQGIMSRFVINYWKVHEDDVKDEDIILQPQDMTMYKHMGFDAGWIWPSVDVKTSFEHKLLEATVPMFSPHESLSSLGGVYTGNTLNDLPYSWWTIGIYDRFLEAIRDPSKVIEVKKNPGSTTDFRKNWEDTIENFGDFMESWVNGIEIVPMPASWVETYGKGLEEAYAQDFVPVPTVHGVFEHAHMLLGDVGIARMLKSKKWEHAFGAVLDNNVRVNLAKATMTKEAGAKIACLADDCAYKLRPMLSPADYDKWIVPRLKQIAAPFLGSTRSSNDPLFFMHSDGYTEPYFPFLSTFMNGIESLEPKAGMDLKGLKERWGGTVALLGNLDVGMLEFSTPQEVAAATKKCLDDAKEGGGYVFCPTTDIPNNATIENVEAMMQAVKQFGQY
jgi:hypothetical protein